jgi:hypothetical protein
MKESFLNLLTNFKEINSWLMVLFNNKPIISVTSLALSLIIVGFIKFNDIKHASQPSDLVEANKYLDRYIALGADDDGSCTEKAKSARGEAQRIISFLEGIIAAHKSDKAFSSVESIYKAMIMRAPSSIPFCNHTLSEKK